MVLEDLTVVGWRVMAERREEEEDSKEKISESVKAKQLLID